MPRGGGGGAVSKTIFSLSVPEGMEEIMGVFSPLAEAMLMEAMMGQGD